MAKSTYITMVQHFTFATDGKKESRATNPAFFVKYDRQLKWKFIIHRCN